MSLGRLWSAATRGRRVLDGGPAVGAAMRVAALAAALCLLLAGCTTDSGLEGTATQPATGVAGGVGDDPPPVRAAPLDPRLDPRVLVYLEVYQVVVPAGTIRGSEPFWKHVNEQALDPGSYDLLYRNGMRVGLAPLGDWAWFKDILSASQTRTQPLAFQGGAMSTAEIPLKPDVAEQTIFFFNRRGNLDGRVSERADNLLSMEFSPVPRRPGDVRIRLCPLVRNHRRQFVVTGDGEHREIRVVQPELLYDLNLETDIPLGSFLVLGPSTEANWRTSLGNNFLMMDGPAGRLEQVLLVVPRAFAMDRQNRVTLQPLPG